MGLLILRSSLAEPAQEGAVFPLAVHEDGRYLIQADGTPWPLLGRSYWGIIGVSPELYEEAIDDAVDKGFNCIEFRAPNGSWMDRNSLVGQGNGSFSPFNGDGVLPFTTILGGGTYTGDVDECPDFTTPNETYFQYLDTFIEYCRSRDVAVIWFPCYVGFQSFYNINSQGWMQAMEDNGATKMQTFGAYIGNRYKNQTNILYAIGGDKGAGDNTFSAGQIAVEQAFITGLKSVSGQQSVQFVAEWDSGTHGSSETNFGDELTTESCYDFGGDTSEVCRDGYAVDPPRPTFLIEEPYDEEGTDGTSKNASATQPCRRFIFRAILNAIGGYMEGNGYLIHFFTSPTDYRDHFSTETQVALAGFNAWWKSIEWWRLVPHGFSPINTLITAGSINTDTDQAVDGCCTPEGDLAVFYGSQSFTSFTVDRTKMRGTITAKWMDPVTFALTTIGGSHPNTGTEVFSDPGNNSAGDGDWFLVLTA